MVTHGHSGEAGTGSNDASLVVLITTADGREAGIVRSALEMLGFTVYQQAEGPLLGYWAAAADNWQSITISSADVETAIAALRQLRADAAVIDWETIDVGKPEDESSAVIAAGNRMGGCSDCYLGGKVVFLFMYGPTILIFAAYPLILISPAVMQWWFSVWSALTILLAIPIPWAWWRMRRQRLMGNRERDLTT